MAVKVNGNRSLGFVAEFDISNLEENARRASTIVADLQRQTNSMSGPKGDNGAYQKEQQAIQKAMEQSRVALQAMQAEQAALRIEQEKSKAILAATRAEMDKLAQAEQELNNRYKAGKITLREYEQELRRIAEAQRETNRIRKEAETSVKTVQDNSERIGQEQLQAALKETSAYYRELAEAQKFYINQQDRNAAASQFLKAELDRLTLAEQQLEQQYKQGTVTLEKYAAEQKRVAEAKAQTIVQKFIVEQPPEVKEDGKARIFQQELQAEINRTSIAYQSLSAAQQEQVNQFQKANQTIAAAEKELKDLVQAEIQVKQSYDAGKVSLQEYEQELKRIQATQKETTRLKKAAQVEVKAVKDDSQRIGQEQLQAALRQTKIDYASLNSEQERSRSVSKAIASEVRNLAEAEQYLTRQYKEGKVTVAEYAAEQKRLAQAKKEAAKVATVQENPTALKADDTARQQQIALQASLKQSREAYAALKVEQQNQRLAQELSKTASIEARQEIDRLTAAEKQLTAEYKNGKMSVGEYVFEQKKIGDALKEQVRIQKEAERAVREQVKVQKEQEVQAERNRKTLEKESSEYYKLSTALGNVRKEAKDALAEMFRMEQAGQQGSDAYKQLEIRSKALSAQTNILDKGIKGIDASLGLHQRNVGNYGSALANLSPRFAAIDQALGAFGTSIDQLATTPDPFKALGTSLLAFGRATVTFMLTPIGAILTALAGLYALISSNKQTVVDFDAGLKGVQKTTGIAGVELEKLGDAVVSMSNELKSVSAKSLLEYAQAAGQLGVKGSQNILRFSETMAKLQVASDISGEEGASAIARLLTLTDGGVENVADFGNEIVRLGNNFAATEKEILGNATRIAQNTGLYKIGRQEVLAYATATKAVGVEAELVGSTFGRTLGEFEKALRTGKNVEVLAKVTGKSVEDLKSSFKTNASGVFNDFVKGLNGIDKAGGSVNGVLAQLGIDAIRDQAVLSSLATNGFKPLNDAMNDARNAGNALGEEFETANQKLANVGARIGIAWDNLILSFENGQGIIATTGAALGNGLADALVSVKEGIDSLGIAFNVAKQYFNDLFPAVDKTSQVTVQYANVLDSLGRFFEGISLKSFLYTFEVQLPNAFREASANVDIIKNTVSEFVRFLGVASPQIAKYIKDALNPFAEADSTALDTLFQNFKSRAKAANKDIVDDTKKTNKQAIDLFNARYKAAENANKIGEELARQDDSEAAKATAEEIKAIEDAAKAKKEAYKQSLAAQRALQGKIDELNTTARRKQLTSDEAEVQAVKDKYIKIRKEVDAFYKDPKNKGLKVDVSGLTASENTELENVAAKQEVEQLKASLSVQKSLFDEFEEYKSTFGQAKAKERFKGDVAEYENYITYLKSLIPPDSDTSIRANKLREALTPELQKAEKEQQKQYDALLKGLMDYEQQRKAIQAKYKADSEALALGGDTAALQELDERYNDAIDALDDANAKKISAFKELFAGVDELTDKQARAVVSAAESKLKDLVKQGKISGDLQQQIEKLLKNTSAAIKDRLPQRLVNLAGSIRNVAGAVSEVDAGFGQVLGTVANVIDNVVAIKDNVSAMQEAFQSGDLLGGLTGAMGVIGGVFAAISVAKGIADQMNAKSEARQRAAAAQQQYVVDMQINANNAIVESLAKQLELIKEIYGTERITEYRRSLGAIRSEYENIASTIVKTNDKLLGSGELFALTGTDAELDEIIKKYNAGIVGAMAFTQEQANKLIPLKGLIEDLNDPLKKDAALLELEELLSKGLLDETTAASIENLLALEEQFKETLNAIRAEVAGFSLDSLIDDIAGIFAEGGDNAAEAFNEKFASGIQKSLLQTFKREALEKQLQAYYAMFAELSESGGALDEQEIAALKAEYDRIIANAQQKFDELEAATGQDLNNASGKGGSGSNQDTLTGDIREKLTEETGGKLAGIMQGQFGLTKQILVAVESLSGGGKPQTAVHEAIFGVNKQQLVIQEGIYSNMGQQLDIAKQGLHYHQQTATNTGVAAETLGRVETILNKIEGNTKSGQSDRDMGLGG